MGCLDLELASGATPGPTGRSYWVVKGRFAAGAYPSKSRPPEPAVTPSEPDEVEPDE